MSFDDFVDYWCISDGDSDGVFCVIDLFTNIVTFSRQLEAKNYVKKS